MTAALQAELLAARDAAGVIRQRDAEAIAPELLEAFETLTGIDPRTRTREAHVMKARQIFCLILSDRGLTTQEIARFMGYDRATIYYSIEQARSLVDYDKQAAYYYKTFERIINKHYGNN